MIITPQLPVFSGSTLFTLGFFDGIHTGHKALFDRILELKNFYARFVLCTFEKPPIAVIKKISSPTLFTFEERLDFFRDLAVDILYIPNMTEKLFSTSAIDFLKSLLLQLKNIHLIIGEEARFGKDQQGGKKFLTDAQKILGENFSFETLPTLNDAKNHKISSSPLRTQFQQGNIPWVNSFLERPLFLKGKVIHGEKRGRLIGFPTLNVAYPMNKIVPPFGVYKSFTVINKLCYHSLTYISNFRLDIISQMPLAETWVAHFDQEIYDEVVTTYLLNLHRPPIKVESLDELKILLEQDKQILD